MRSRARESGLNFSFASAVEKVHFFIIFNSGKYCKSFVEVEFIIAIKALICLIIRNDT